MENQDDKSTNPWPRSGENWRKGVFSIPTESKPSRPRQDGALFSIAKSDLGGRDERKVPALVLTLTAGILW